MRTLPRRSAVTVRPARGRAGRMAFALAFLFVLALFAVLLAPMRQAARVLPAATGGVLEGVEAEGLWHDGALRLACRLPAGRWLDCGRYAVRIGVAGIGVQAEAVQAEGGRVAGRLGAAGWELDLAGFRVPMSSLALLFPLAGQMQLGGIAWIDGRVTPPGRVALDVRWQGEVGAYPTGEQRLRVEGDPRRVELRFVPVPGDAPRPLRAEGGVLCDLPAAGEAARCRGAIDFELAQADPRLEELVAATSRRMGPGRYRMQVDAR